MNQIAILVIAGAAALLLAAFMFMAKSRRRRSALATADLPGSIKPFGSPEIMASIADRWEGMDACGIDTDELLAAIGGMAGFKAMRHNADEITGHLAILADSLPREGSRAHELQKNQAEVVMSLIREITREAVQLRISTLIAESEMAAIRRLGPGEMKPYHGLNAVWRYQRMVDWFYQVLSEMHPRVVERLEYML